MFDLLYKPNDWWLYEMQHWAKIWQVLTIWQSEFAKNDIEQPYGVFFEDQFNVSTIDVDLLTRLMPTQLTFTCSKSTIETLEKDVKHVQS